ncbi:MULTISPECIES: hypothetical protein [Pseudarthrobacter]|jgi:hypothetical protein|uniref:hypothetical protein n=1 Tax=Pseudarthrobacter TaxID=1742993 RepID=UPI001FCAD44E|nr:MULTISPECIES: hypothetical protein [Pseudarthrobacter]MDP9999536.1 hypothetical protein [Pseudarthrobacter sulfonivorans]
MTISPEKTAGSSEHFMPKFGQMLSPEAKGILVLDEFTLDPAEARKEQHGFRAAMASVALTLRRIVALRVVIALVAIGNLPLFLLNSGWWIYAVSLVLVVAVHLAVSWLNKHEPKVRQRQMLELHLHRERSANYRKVRDAVKYMIDAPGRMNEHLYLELLAAKRVALNVAHGTVALLDTSDAKAWKVRIVREIPAIA